jgi:thymidylate synthase (FAD)
MSDEDRRLPVRMADAAQYAREPIPVEQRGQIRVRLLNATPDPLGSIAALGKQYKGEVVRSLSEVTDEERRQYLDDFTKTVLNGPLEAAQFHFQIEGVTRSITHQMVRSRASFFAQESLRFAVPEGDWAEEIPLPPSLAGPEADNVGSWQWNARRTWHEQMGTTQIRYERLIGLGMPAEEARGILPHDMPTRIHWVLDLRTLLTEAGKRTCTQAQFPWRVIFAGIAKALRDRAEEGDNVRQEDGSIAFEPFLDNWQFEAIADRLRPVCFQTGSCGFMAQFDRSCNIRERVDIRSTYSHPKPDPSQWSKPFLYNDPKTGKVVASPGIQDWEWAADPGAARS